MTALDEAAKSASAGRAAVSREPTRQDDDPRSLTSQVGEPGLPLAFGDVERPVRPVRRVQAPTEERAPIDYEKLLVPIFLFAAVCILMFTVVRLWGERAPAADVQAEEVPVAVEAAPVEPPPEAATDTPVAPSTPRAVQTLAPEPKPEPVPVEVRTEAPPTGPTTLPGTGHITISSIPTARVYVDGEFIRTTPVFRLEVDAGSRQIELRAKDGRTHRFPLGVRDGADLNRVWSFEESQFVGD